MSLVTLDEVREARSRARDFVLRTPLLPALTLPTQNGAELWLKAENLQRTGSFKIRGAFNAVAGLSDEERRRGVVTYSSGNHGQAVACAAQSLGVKAIVVMPEDAIPVKVEATRRWGAAVVFEGLTSIARYERAMDLVREHGYAVIPPFDDPCIIAGQGTVGLEIVEQLPDVDAVIVPTGGGGLLSGVATAVKSLRPDVRVIGVEPEGAADARDSLHSESPVTWDRIETVADGLRTSRIGDLNFETIRNYVDEIVTVSEDEILKTVGLIAAGVKVIAEPSGAAATAAVLFGRCGVESGRVVAIISGGNIAPSRLSACLDLVSEPAYSTVPART